jgi:ribosomal protein S3
MKKFPAETLEIASQISSFYLRKYNFNTEAANAMIESLRIFDIKKEEGVIEIHTSRPGLLIGKKGSNIDGLTVHLGSPIKIVEVQSLSDLMLIYDPADFEDW